MARDPKFVINYLEEVEHLAEDVLTDKQQIIDLDTKRNQNREALAALHKKTVAPPNSKHKAWLNCGGMFIKVKKDFAIDVLKYDQNELDKEINSLRGGLHKKVERLRDAEGKSDLKGFNLKAMNKSEMDMFKY